MSCFRPSFRTSSVLAAIVLAAGSLASIAQAQVGTAISYQGQLKSAGQVVNTDTDMRFTLFDAATSGNVVGGPVTIPAVPVSNGLFNANPDFGFNPYTLGQDLWLLIEVRNPAGSGSYVPMGSRQKLTPAPYSLATRGIKVADNGNVGIGGDATFWRVTATTPANDRAFVHINPTDGVAVGTFISSSAGYYGTFTDHPLKFFTSSHPYDEPGIVLRTDGKVGIGTNDPSRMLDVNGPARVQGSLAAGNLDNFGNHMFSSRVAASTPGVDIAVFGSHEGTSGFNAGLYGRTQSPNGFGVFSEGNFQTSANALVLGNVGVGTTTPNERLSVLSNDTDAARIASTNTASTRFHVQNTSTNGRDWYLAATGATAASGPGNFQIVDASAGVTRLHINTAGNIGVGTVGQTEKLDVNGNVRCVSLIQTSAREFKQDIVPLSNALDAITKLRGVTYAWNNLAPADVQGRHDIGFIADEVNQVLPDIVAKDESGRPIGIDYGKITPVAVEAIKQLKAENEDLRARLEKLEALFAAQSGTAR